MDTARGLALIGMFSVHVYGAFAADGSPTPAWMFAGGRSASTFALMAGMGLAFTTGRGRGRGPACAPVTECHEPVTAGPSTEPIDTKNP
ncbi:hypothetical protein [Streptomyces sp. NBC_00005]|uniref:hypothetical protein n=1 Tax=Streptomyces sp. NBC_00005 TaxID=2903609 RepID=UPI003255DB6B